jgi:hypothetical protein
MPDLQFSRPRPDGGSQAPNNARPSRQRSGHRFRELPEPIGEFPFRLRLEDVIGLSAVEEIRKNGAMSFHAMGDSGPIKDPDHATLVARGMERDLEKLRGARRPRFLYHLGDVVYYNGEVSRYFEQFYQVYENYENPILAIPGNHDGDAIDGDVSLHGFVRNFCQTGAARMPEAGEVGRDAMIQPNVYWTFDCPFAWIIGMYTNVTEGGSLDRFQAEWLAHELAEAPEDRALLLALHHPIHSFDDHHSGSHYMGAVVSQAINQSRRVPNMFLTGHVHDYQRIEQTIQGRKVPFLVAGAGGYYHLHRIKADEGDQDPDNGSTLIRGIDDRHGFLRLQLDKKQIKGTYVTVPRPQESWSDDSLFNEADQFTYDAKPIKLNPGEAVMLSG